MSAARWLWIAALALAAVSLALPAIRGSGFPTQSGLDVLNQGADAWRDGIVAWYANPVLCLAAVIGFFGAGRRPLALLAFALAVLGLLLALSSFTAGAAAANAGRRVPEFSYASGFYVWLFGFGIAVVAGGLGLGTPGRPRSNRDPV